VNSCLARLLAASLLLMASACIKVERDTELSCQVEPVAADWDLVVAPFFSRDRVELFQKALRDASSHIEVVDSETLWRAVFPDRDPDADVRISEFRQANVAARMRAAGVHHMIVLDTEPSTVRGKEVVTVIYGTQKEATTHEAIMLSFNDDSCEVERYTVLAKGRDHLVWYAVGVFFNADTEGDALQEVTERMTRFMAAEAAARPVKVAVVASR
jgi:hypothetical protein